MGCPDPRPRRHQMAMQMTRKNAIALGCYCVALSSYVLALIIQQLIIVSGEYVNMNEYYQFDLRLRWNMASGSAGDFFIVLGSIFQDNHGRYYSVVRNVQLMILTVFFVHVLANVFEFYYKTWYYVSFALLVSWLALWVFFKLKTLE